jgi:ATP-dependent RNA helicase DeaD
VPDDTVASKFNEKNLEAFLEGLLEELKHPQDAKLLEEVRRAFRKKVPFHLRSYASALMILRAAGIYRSKSPQKVPHEPSRHSQHATDQARAEVKQEPQNKAMVSLFVSMGKRQHLKPMELKKKIAERTGLPQDVLGRVHLLENYSFIEVPVDEAQRIVSAMVGLELNGRALEIKPAKKRSESLSEGL